MIKITLYNLHDLSDGIKKQEIINREVFCFCQELSCVSPRHLVDQNKCRQRNYGESVVVFSSGSIATLQNRQIVTISRLLKGSVEKGR